MHPDRQLIATMKAALITMKADVVKATHQTRQLCRVMEQMSPADLAVTTEEVDGSSYAQALAETCVALEAMCEAYDELRTTIERGTATC